MEEAVVISRLIIPPASAREIVAGVDKVYLRDCQCRAREQACPRDTWEVCLLFEDADPDELRHARRIMREKALAILKTTAERRAINQLFYTEPDHQLTEICSCCTCCCFPLRRVKREGNYAEELRSEYVAVTNPELCVACGECEETCFFEARTVEGDTLYLVDERCFGCGRCVESCPEGAIRLEFQAGRGVPIPFAV
jgi:electron transport complex protein RnfB